MKPVRRRFVATLLGLTSMAMAARGSAREWVEWGPAPILDGPFSGRMSAVVASPNDARKVYGAGASGGVWKSLDGGTTWTPLTDDLPTNTIGALALDPRDDDVVYAGSGEANFANHSFYGEGMYKSVDGGQSWQVLGGEIFGGRTFSRIVVSPDDSSRLYAAVMPAGGFPARNAAKGHPRRNDPVGVYRSRDGGESWELLRGGLPAVAASDLCLDPGNPQIVYAAIGDIFGPPENGIYKSVDGGSRWTRIGLGFPTSKVGRTSLAVAPSDPARLYALVTNPADPFGGSATTHGVFRSDDGGDTWIPRHPGNIQVTYGWYLSTVIVDPLDPNIVFVGGLNLLRSQNAGDSWFVVTPPHVDMHGLAYDASHRLLCANDGGLHRSPNNGESWEALTVGLGVVQFYAGLSVHPSSPDTIFGGTQDNGTNRRERGTNWTIVLGGDGGYTALHPDTPNVIWAEFQGTANLLRSDDGGDTFFFRNTGIDRTDRNCFLPPISYHPHDANVLLYATHRIYQTTDTGRSWAPISEDLTGGIGAIRALVMAPSNPQTVYAATNNGRVLVSTDGGATWDLRLTGLPGWPRVTREIAVDPAEDARAYLAVSHFGVDQILRTNDRGHTWEAIDGDLPDIPANTVAAHRIGDRTAVFLGTDRGVFMTCEDGMHWERYGDGLPHSPVNDLVVDLRFDRLIALTMGRGMWSHALPDLQDCPTLPRFIRGDADGDGTAAGLADALFSLNHGFIAGSPPPPCTEAADADGDGVLNALIDSIFILALGFIPGSPAPPPPYPECAIDPEFRTSLGCDFPPPPCNP